MVTGKGDWFAIELEFVSDDARVSANSAAPVPSPASASAEPARNSLRLERANMPLQRSSGRESGGGVVNLRMTIARLCVRLGQKVEQRFYGFGRQRLEPVGHD